MTMNNRIDLKDGFCVSCGRKAGVIYHSCPFCNEQVWHPLWRQFIFWYVIAVLPLFALSVLIIDRAAFAATAEAFVVTSSSKLQVFATAAVAFLLLPYENSRLVFTSTRCYVHWVLNALAASLILLLCVLLFAVGLRFSTSSPALRFLMGFVAVSGAAIPLVLNCNWWRVFAAFLCAIALAFV